MHTSTTDPITLAVIKGGLEQIVDEMDVALYRASFSTIVSEGHDACHGLYADGTGDTIVQGKFGLPIFVGVMSFAVRAVIDYLAARNATPQPGDLYALNDTFLSGTHLQDVKLVKPFFHPAGELFCWIAGTAHWTDIGGNVPGGFNARAGEALQEGLVIPPVKLVSGGELNRDLLDLLLANNRVPRVAYGDLNAQLGAIERGEGRLRALLERYGVETVRAVQHELANRSEQMMRAHIATIPNGTYSFEDRLDSDGIVDEPLTVALDLTVEDERLVLDFRRSSPVCRGPFNITLPTTVASCYIGLKHLFTDVPLNAGCFRPVEVIAPAGTLLNAPRGSAVNAYTEVTPVVLQTVWGALAQAVPARSNAAYFTTVNSLNVAGRDGDGNYRVMFTYHGGGHGAHGAGDGLNHGSNAISMATIAPVEILESNFPVVYESWALRPDSGGAGTFRGGLGARYCFRWLGDEGRAFFVGDKGKQPPFGLAGGESAAPNRIVFHLREGEFVPPLLTKATDVPLARGDRVELLTPGGGGHGDPKARNRDRVRRDVKLGYVSAEAAREVYGLEEE